ncbi:MAG: helix-turn-helix transcriptional regulator [Pseudomonadota bacterium]
MAKFNPEHLGSSLDEVLARDGTLAETEALATKQVLAWQLEALMNKKRITKAEMAKRMNTSRSSLDRLLDPDNPSVTLGTMDRAAAVFGKHLHVELIDRPTT